MKFEIIADRLEEYIPEIIEYGVNRIFWCSDDQEKRLEYEKIKNQGPYSYFYEVVNHFTVYLLEEKPTSDACKKLFQFFEMMATDDDDYIVNLLTVEVLEHIRDQVYSIYSSALSQMGPHTLLAEKTLDSYMGKPQK